MKYFKTLINTVIILITIFVATNAIAQDNMRDGVLSLQNPKNSTFLKIPSTLKSVLSLEQAIDKKGTKTLTKYSSDLGSNISVSFDKNGKVIAILIYKNVDKDILLNQNRIEGKACPECNAMTMGDLQFLWCIADCIVTTIEDIIAGN